MNPLPATNLYKRHRFAAAIIGHCVWRYLRFSLSYRNVEALMAACGVMLTYEAVRDWWWKFGQVYVNALRPSTTIIIAEDKFKFPFDINQISIRRYKHLGDDIGVTEVKRFTTGLKKAVTEILANDPPDDDSPVYTFLQGLRRLKLLRDLSGNAEPVMAAVAAADIEVAPDKTHSALMQKVDEAQKQGDFTQAKALLGAVRAMRPDDPYITQRLALVTYKAEQDTPAKEIAALKEACDLLFELAPGTSNDTETLGLWGAVHKRLWDKTKDEVALDKAVRSYERGFYLRNDYYNSINLAFLLNVRAAKMLCEPCRGKFHFSN